MKLPILLSSCLFFLLSLYVGFSQNTIFGTVTDGQNPIQGASVVVKGTSNGTSTDALGKYAISASPEDILVFSYVGMQTVEVIVEDVTKVLNVQLGTKVEELDEVVVTKYRRKTQLNLSRNYYSDKSIIHCYFGYLSPDLVGYDLRVIDGESLNHKAIDILAAITEKFPGVTLRIKEGNRLLFASSYGALRGRAPLVYSLDGRILTDAPLGVDIKSIVRVAIIPPGQAIQKYGSIARGGILIINTNSIIHSSREDGNRPYDQVRLRNNLYTNDALSQDAVLENGPTYLKELYNSEDSSAASEVYKRYVAYFSTSYAFVLDAYRCLLTNFGDEKLAENILGEHTELFNENPVAIKALAYVYQENGDLTSANKLYKKLFLKRPHYVQSYLDLARSYREIGQYEKAAQLFSRFDYLSKQDYFDIRDSMMVSKIVDREFNNLLALEGDQILSSKELRRLETDQYEFQGTRLVFEWNDGEAEFELQFVNPEGRFYKTEHSLLADGEQIREQKMLGYSMEEFLIDGIMPGQWQVNVKYLGNKQLSPTYLKSTIYHNYGKTNQEKEIKVFKLGLRNVNQELFKVDVSSVLTND